MDYGHLWTAAGLPPPMPQRHRARVALAFGRAHPRKEPRLARQFAPPLRLAPPVPGGAGAEREKERGGISKSEKVSPLGHQRTKVRTSPVRTTTDARSGETYYSPRQIDALISTRMFLEKRGDRYDPTRRRAETENADSPAYWKSPRPGYDLAADRPGAPGRKRRGRGGERGLSARGPPTLPTGRASGAPWGLLWPRRASGAARGQCGRLARPGRPRRGNQP